MYIWRVPYVFGAATRASEIAFIWIMFKKISFLILIQLGSPLSHADVPISNLDKMTQDQKVLLARVIFRNETNCNADDLMQWNKYENFLSLGILHTVATHRFYSTSAESFPTFWKFIVSQHSQDPKRSEVQVPQWMIDRPVQKGWIPDEWVTVREEPKQLTSDGQGEQSCFPSSDSKNKPNYALKFDELSGKIGESRKVKDSRIQELKNFLNHPRVVSWQAQFAMERTENGLRRILESLKMRPQDLNNVTANMKALLSSPQGIIALVDYTNWKGEGLVKDGANNSGLKEVLINMTLPKNFSQLSQSERNFVSGRAFGNAAALTLRKAIERRYNEAGDRSECGLQRAREQYNRWMGWLAKAGETFPCYEKLDSSTKSTCKKVEDGGFYVRIQKTYVRPNFEEVQKNCAHLGQFSQNANVQLRTEDTAIR